MHRLFTRMLLALVPPAVVLGVLIGWQCRIQNAHFVAAFRVQPETVIAIFGDSHVRCGLDPKQLNRAQSFAQDGEPLWVTAAKIRRVLEQASPQLQCVVLGMPTHAPYFWFAKKRNYYHERAKHFPFVPAPPAFQQEERFCERVEIALTGCRLLVRRWCRRSRHPEFVGGYLPQKGCVWERKTRRDFVAQNLADKYGDHERFSDLSTRFLSVLQEIDEMCRSRQIQLVLAETPCACEYRENIPLLYVRHFQQIVETTQDWGIPYLNFSDYPLDRRCFFDIDPLASHRGCS